MTDPDPPDSTSMVVTGDGTRLVVDIWDPVPDAEGGSPSLHDQAVPGHDRAVLLVHGLASNARLWDGVASALRARGDAVAAVDLRGHGRSAKPDVGYDHATISSDLVAVLASLEAGGGSRWARPVVAGQSWGGNVVVDLAWRNPDLVSAVVCVDGGVIDLQARFANEEEMRRTLAPPAIAGMRRDDLEHRLGTAHPSWSESAIHATLANMELRPDGTVAPWLSHPHHMQILDAMWRQRPIDQLTELVVPVLLLMADDGTDSSWVQDKRAAVDAAVAVARQTQVRWFTPADHDVHAQFPDQVAEAIDQFCTASAGPGFGPGPTREGRQ